MATDIHRHDPPDDTVVRVADVRWCGVCGEECYGALELPEKAAICQPCATAALRWMLDDARSVRGEGSRAFAPKEMAHG